MITEAKQEKNSQFAQNTQLNAMGALVFEKLSEQRKDVINLVFLLSFAPEGLLLFDIIRVVYLNK